MLLSILIPTLKARSHLLERLLSVLRPQVNKDVEIITLADEGEATIGDKRNRLIEMAQGEYICFVDDDDLVSNDYVKELMFGIDMGVDTVSIRGIYNHDGQMGWPFDDCPYQGHSVSRVNGKEEFKRGLQHLDATKRSIAKAVKFPSISHGEDYEWGTAIERMRLVKTWHRVSKPIYFYEFVSVKKRPAVPKLGVVIPAYNHCYLTSRTIESLLQNISDKNVCIILIDDASEDGLDTWVLGQDLGRRLGSLRFHYHRNETNLGVNASWNAGIRIAKARGVTRIAIVNNDVLFAPEWEKPMMEALDDPTIGIVSPLSTWGQCLPWDWPTGTHRSYNPAGYMGYMPILGACFMVRTDLFDTIGYFPDELKIYFGDNWIAGAVQKAGLQAGYVTDSYIHHFVACTTAALDNNMLFEKEGAIYERICEDMGWRLVPFAEEQAHG